MPEMDNFKAPHAPLRSRWREQDLLMRGPLTDRKIERYQRQGWYSEEMRAARRNLQARKAGKVRVEREGNFIRKADGRLVYSPL